jgi:iron(III) transport system substrate-binding protein
MKTRSTIPLLILGIALAACSRESTTEVTATTSSETTQTIAAAPPSTGPLVIYSGRSEKLIGPILERFKQTKKIDLEVRYGATAEMAATILEEGAATPADVFIAQDAAALGAVTAAGLAKDLPADVLETVPSRFRSADSKWVGLSGRARTVVYNTRKVKEGDLPQTLEQLGDSKYKGRFGVAPSNASLQAHLAVYSVLKGEAALQKLLSDIVRNEPRRYPNNAAIVQAAGNGEIDFGLVNHYYPWQAKKQNPSLPVGNFHMTEGVGNGWVNVSGIAVFDPRPEALELVRYLLEDEAQKYFAQETSEYPITANVKPSEALPPLETLVTPDIDYAKVSAVLPRTLELINSSGLAKP